TTHFWARVIDGWFHSSTSVTIFSTLLPSVPLLSSHCTVTVHFLTLQFTAPVADSPKLFLSSARQDVSTDLGNEPVPGVSAKPILNTPGSAEPVSARMASITA